MPASTSFAERIDNVPLEPFRTTLAYVAQQVPDERAGHDDDVARDEG